MAVIGKLLINPLCTSVQYVAADITLFFNDMAEVQDCLRLRLCRLITESITV
jgi:hypothetical protein